MNARSRRSLQLAAQLRRTALANLGRSEADHRSVFPPLSVRRRVKPCLLWRLLAPVR